MNTNPFWPLPLTPGYSSLREGNGTPLQYSCLENPMDGGAWQAAVHGVARSQTLPSDITFTFPFHALRSKWQPTPVFLPGESQGLGSLVGCRLWGHTESDMTEATQQQQRHSSLLHLSLPTRCFFDDSFPTFCFPGLSSLYAPPNPTRSLVLIQVCHCLFCFLIYPGCLKLWLAHSGSSVSIHGTNECQF